MPDHAIARISYCAFWEFLLWRLQLLQAYDIGRRLLQPAKHIRKPSIDAVDVECSDAHARYCSGDTIHDARPRSGARLRYVLASPKLKHPHEHSNANRQIKEKITTDDTDDTENNSKNIDQIAFPFGVVGVFGG